MSGPFDRPDDPDEVTLWAGRLRAWPTPPATDDASAELDDDTVRVHAAEPDADTVLSQRTRAADDTAVSTADDDEIGATAPRRGSTPAPPAPAIDDEIGATAPRRGSAPAPPAPAIYDQTNRGPAAMAHPDLDDETVRRPAPTGAPGLDDETIRRPAPTGAPDLDDETIRRPAPTAAPDLDDDTVRRPSVAPADLDDDTRPRAALADVDDTAAGSRRSRREASARQTPADGPLPPVVSRDARVPAALHRDTYAPRLDAPVRVERSLPAHRPSVSDASAVRPRSARRGTVRVVVLAAVVVVIVAAAVAGVLLLIG